MAEIFMGFSEYFQRQQQMGRGGAIALIDEQCSLSYQELTQAITDRVTWFRQWPQEQHFFALSFNADIWSVVTYLACLEAKIPLLLIDPQALSELVTPQLNRLGVCVWIKNPQVQLVLANQKPLCRKDLALLLSTSGSTGGAKSVMLSRENLVSNARSISQYLPMGEQDCGIASLPLSYSYGLSLLNSHLMVGARFVLTGQSLMTKDFWKLMREHKVSSLAGVPFSYQMLKTLRFERMDLPTLKVLTQAGGRLNIELAQHFYQLAQQSGRQFFMMYGQTEATARIAYLPPQYLPEYGDCIGIAIPHGELYLRDLLTNERFEEINQPGELYYQGPNVMLGYANGANDLNSATCITELATGDIAERLANGLFRITGRKSRFIKLQGKRLSLDEIEANLNQAGMRECIACGRDDTLVIAFLASSSRESIQAYCVKTYGLHPTQFKLLACPVFPRLSNGKPDYQRLLVSAQAGMTALPAIADLPLMAKQDAEQGTEQ